LAAGYTRSLSEAFQIPLRAIGEVKGVSLLLPTLPCNSHRNPNTRMQEFFNRHSSQNFPKLYLSRCKLFLPVYINPNLHIHSPFLHTEAPNLHIKTPRLHINSFDDYKARWAKEWFWKVGLSTRGIKWRNIEGLYKPEDKKVWDG